MVLAAWHVFPDGSRVRSYCESHARATWKEHRRQQMTDGGQAFPCQQFKEQFTAHGDVSGLALAGRSSGMTKREVFAGLAMQGMVAGTGEMPMREYEAWPARCADWAVRHADALLTELERKPDAGTNDSKTNPDAKS